MIDFTRIGVRLLVKDFAKCYDFYTEAMGLVPVWGDRNGPYTSFTGAAGAEPNFAIFLVANMALYEGYAPPQNGGGDQVQLVLPCDDVDKAYIELKAKGVEFLGEPQTIEDWGMRCVVLRDPEGNLLELNDSGSA
ncbi:MAG: glyoxalase/bleomycin resistance/dioxygenase family protein [Ruminococcaceae bacterium]|mgnify:CR=1 FL=1|nr:glyoxalase/bleomycin resistance/dioxygenase family protein [Oscillospiraceae bacterium]